MAAAFLVQIGDYQEVSMYVGQQQQLAINRLQYLIASVTGPAQGADVFALAFFNYISPFLHPCMTSLAEFINVGVRRLVPAPVTVEQLASPPAPVAGSGGTSPLPGQVAGLLTKRTGLAGRKNRGRIYVPFPDQVHVNFNTNFPIAAYLADLNTLALQLKSPITFIAAGTTYTCDLQLYHRATKTFTPTSDVISRPRFATQRRRGNYGRVNVAPG
jgi:hypothetical protein